MQNQTITLENAIEIPLYPRTKAPGKPETIIERSIDTAQHDRAVSDITDPSMFMFKPENPNGAAMLIVPGGSLLRIAIDKEGVDIARWLASIGITPFILKYRLPGKTDHLASVNSLDDAIRAMRLIRHNAGTYGISPDRIGVMGFSAGGYIAARMGCCPVNIGYAPMDAADAEPFSPALLALIYPLITFSPSHTHEPSREALLGECNDEQAEKALSVHCNIKEGIPPVFLCHAKDDVSVSVENSLLLYLGLREKNVPIDMHLFGEGGHGFCLRYTAGLPVEEWSLLCERWMRRNSFI